MPEAPRNKGLAGLPPHYAVLAIITLMMSSSLAQLSRGRHNAEGNFVARLISMCWAGVLLPLLRII